MFSCKEIARLVSESLDHTLPFGQRVAVRFHLMMCSLCSRFRRQMLFVREMGRRFGKGGDRAGMPATVRLSPEARERIRCALKREGL
jgi:hypothetical protein